MIKKFSSLNSDETKFWIGMQYQGPNQGKYDLIKIINFFYIYERILQIFLIKGWFKVGSGTTVLRWATQIGKKDSQ